MSEEDKAYMKRLFKEISDGDGGIASDMTGNEIKSIDAFLEFKESNDICG